MPALACMYDFGYISGVWANGDRNSVSALFSLWRAHDELRFLSSINSHGSGHESCVVVIGGFSRCNPHYIAHMRLALCISSTTYTHRYLLTGHLVRVVVHKNPSSLDFVARCVMSTNVDNAADGRQLRYRELGRAWLQPLLDEGLITTENFKRILFKATCKLDATSSFVANANRLRELLERLSKSKMVQVCLLCGCLRVWIRL